MTLSIQTRVPKPPRILLYGPQKIGKSTFGANAPNPIFIQTEDGLDNIQADAYPLAPDYPTVMKYITELCTQEYKYETLVVDSADWLEPMIWAQVAKENGKRQIEDIGYGKGYMMALDVWREYIAALNFLREEKNMMIVQIAHSEIKRFENPETDGYDRYNIKLHKGAAALLAEHSEIILFANYYVGIKKNKSGFNNETVKAVGSGERILYTEERPSFIAGNRYGLPPEIPFTADGSYWNVLAKHIPYFNQTERT